MFFFIIYFFFIGQVIFHKMQDIIKKKKYVLELKSKIHNSEEQENKLQEYVKTLKDMIHKFSHCSKMIPNLNSELVEYSLKCFNIYMIIFFKYRYILRYINAVKLKIY